MYKAEEESRTAARHGTVMPPKRPLGSGGPADCDKRQVCRVVAAGSTPSFTGALCVHTHVRICTHACGYASKGRRMWVGGYMCEGMGMRVCVCAHMCVIWRPPPVFSTLRLGAGGCQRRDHLQRCNHCGTVRRKLKTARCVLRSDPYSRASIRRRVSLARRP